MYILRPGRAAFMREREREQTHEIHDDILVLTGVVRLIHMQRKKVSFSMGINFLAFIGKYEYDYYNYTKV